MAREDIVVPRGVMRHEEGNSQTRSEGLPMRWAPGRAPSIPDDLAPEIIAGIKQGPSGYGLDRATWTYGELTTYL